MDLNVLEYFCTIAKAGSLSKAAAVLGIEQSTLTRHIGKLEDSVGVKLFHRTGRGMVLNEKGQIFFEYANEMTEAADRARKVARELAAQGPAHIIVAAQPTLAQVTFGPILHALKREYPTTTVRFVEALGSQILTWLQEGKVDVALLYMPSNSKLIPHERLVQEPFYCLSPPGPQPKQNSMTAREFIDLPLVIPSTAHGIRTQAQSFADRYGKRLNISVECDGSTHLMRQLVQMGHGHTLLPFASAASEVSAGLMRATRIDDSEAVRSVVMATTTGKVPMVGLSRVTGIIKETIAEIVARKQWPGVDKMS
ncbi:LysR family transcriptional regulator [Paraburkholderia acidisoli]|uniref:LysR family transcriptional regulator n=1 Tax=Paraburkholderia acidisoli TaxID=2571748 RepID=A0A7Z2GLH0_9BURK|nr:LysR family transcriptional regulator [Paraburkholderia acidisoli]QGZ63619.1 LysR family transcriptional regulator [Paraburkholderia acidisoli]